MSNIDFFVISVQVWTSNQSFYKNFAFWGDVQFPLDVSLKCLPIIVKIERRLHWAVLWDILWIWWYEYFIEKLLSVWRRPPTKRLRGRNFHRVRSSVLSLTGAMKNADDRNFCLADYDAIGFDLDNTLAKYKLVNLMNVRVPIEWLVSVYLICEKHVIILLSVSYETWPMFFFIASNNSLDNNSDEIYLYCAQMSNHWLHY